ncbi:four-helix bundle copper-binding protein [Exiguobacterium sp. s80]|uniref:four-helix bundle copper-binding protein n=1 Tax=Exiguobacterium sp. s80 TaxID=2751209 RepID=UPI001BE7C3EB|nr:four-helix bundle copper-binding protein [Exiguobacterium sp. s80]
MMSENHQAVLTELNACIMACNACFDACLNEEHVAHMAGCIRLDRDCADICGLLRQAIARNSSNVSVLAKACIEICRACAKECAGHDHDHCQKCAEACEVCATACERLV